MFAHQSDIIIRSDYIRSTSAECIFQFLVTEVACHKYTIVTVLSEKKSTIAAWNTPAYPSACVGVKVCTFKMPSEWLI